MTLAEVVRDVLAAVGGGVAIGVVVGLVVAALWGQHRWNDGYKAGKAAQARKIEAGQHRINAEAFAVNAARRARLEAELRADATAHLPVGAR